MKTYRTPSNFASKPSLLVIAVLLLLTTNLPLRAEPAGVPSQPGQSSPAAWAASTASTAIPFHAIGARATADYQGDALGITATTDGFQLRCGFQQLTAEATDEGLWLTSTEDAGGRFRLRATGLGRDASWTFEVKPATPLPATGTVVAGDQRVAWVRPGLTEEYSVSADGVRQDFVIAERPAGAGELRVELALEGARAETAADGARLTVAGSGRELAYSRLEVVDAAGRKLAARLEAVAEDRLVVCVADADATYPVRIDPTFSDADWVSLNPGIPGTDGEVFAIVADASGNVYIGGDFTFVGTVTANYIAKWNGSTWSALGSGITVHSPYGGVFALAVSGSDLYVGGDFETAGGVPSNGIAKWNGSTWSALGSGMFGSVYALAVNGSDLYAGGAFWTAGGAKAINIAKWNGSTWSALGSGMDKYVKALAVSGSDLYAGGGFTTAGGVTVNRIAKWNGSTWSALGSGVLGAVNALAVNGSDLYAAGTFETAGGVTVNHIAKWNGSTWSALGSGVNDDVFALAVSGSDLYAGGDFRMAGGVAAAKIAKWNGSSWSALDLGVDGDVHALAVSGSDLYAGGKFTTAGGDGFSTADGVTVNHIAKWNGSTWSAPGSGVNSVVGALAVNGSDLYAGGFFTAAGGVPANYIAKWNGSTWSALGSGMTGGDRYCGVNALAVSGSDLYAGGYFTTVDGVTVNYVAKWNGSTWSALGSGMSHWVFALAVSGGELYAGGDFTSAGGVPANYIAKWNGSTWAALGSGTDGWVYALAVSGSDLYAGGYFTTAGGVPANYIAKWNGSTWSALGSGMRGFYPEVRALAVSGSDLYAGGWFTTAGGVAVNHIAKWNGSTWSALGSGMLIPEMSLGVRALAVSGSDLYAGGDFTTAGEVAAKSIAKWNGSTWSALGSGVNGEVRALATDPRGHLFVGGDFMTAGTKVSPYIAQANLPPTPPPVTLEYFRATIAGQGGIHLTWGTLAEVETLGFLVDRRTAEGGWQRVTPGLIPAAGSDQQPHDYSYRDATTSFGCGLRFRLLAVDPAGNARVLAETLAQPEVSAMVRRSGGNVTVEFCGEGGSLINVETAVSMTGPWTLLQGVRLDADGRATLTVDLDPNGLARFYRWNVR